MAVQPKSEKQKNEEAKALYDRFVREKGELFKQEWIPMQDEDLKAVKKNDRFTRRITAPVFYTVAAFAVVGGIYLVTTGDWHIAIGIFLCAIALVSFSLYLVSYYKEILNQKEKLLITGIVTGKSKLSRQYETRYCLKLNEQKEVVVTEKQCKEFHLGDMVQYETLSEERYIKHTITLIGKISDHLNPGDGEKIMA